MLVPRHVAVGLLLRPCRGLEVVVVWVRGLRGHVAAHRHAGGQRALHQAVGVAHPWDGIRHGVGGVHISGEGLHGLLGNGAHVSRDRAGFLLHRALGHRSRGGHRSAGVTGGHQARLLGVALLQVAGQVISPAEALGAAGAQEVPTARVHHRVASHVFAGVETSVAALAGVLPLPHWHGHVGAAIRRGRSVNVSAQVLQQGGRSLGAGQAPGTAMGGDQVSPVAQLGVVLFATLLAVEDLPAGRVALLQLPL